MKLHYMPEKKTDLRLRLFDWELESIQFEDKGGKGLMKCDALDTWKGLIDTYTHNTNTIVFEKASRLKSNIHFFEIKY